MYLNLFSADQVDCAFLLGGPLVCLVKDSAVVNSKVPFGFFTFNSYGISRGLME